MRFAVFGIAAQGESNEYCALLLWKNIAPGMKIDKDAPNTRPAFALVTQCIVWGLSCYTKDEDLKMEQFLSRFTTVVFD